MTLLSRLRRFMTVRFRPFAGPQHVQATSGPWGEGHPGNYYDKNSSRP